MQQLNLFDNDPIARVDDPYTSHQAAAEIEYKLVGLRAKFVERLRALGTATANEVARGEESVRKRAVECLRAGVIKVVCERQCSVTGKNAMAYSVVDKQKSEETK